MSDERLFAVFVDGENASHRRLEASIAEVESQGTIAFKRVYADWTNPTHKNWEDSLKKVSARPYQQFHYDKDSTDNTLLLDAFETVLMNPRINAVCIVASDHIYHSIAMRIRERGLYMLGIGNRNTPRSFVDACSNFVFFDNLPEMEADIADTQPTKSIEEKDVERLLINAVRRAGGEKAALANVGHHIKQLDPAFDPRSYGHGQLLTLFESYGGLFKVEKDEKTPPSYYVSIRALGQELVGSVKKWVPAAGYGFIESDSGQYYFHKSNLSEGTTAEELKKGSDVRFEVFKKPNPDGETTEEKNGKASNVRIDTRAPTKLNSKKAK